MSRSGFCRDPLGDLSEGVGGKGVVVVEQSDVLAGCEFERGIRGRGDPAGALASLEVDTGVRGGVALESGDDLRVGGAVVDQAELPIRERLLPYGADRLLEHLRGRIVDGGQHRDQRRPGAVKPLLPIGTGAR